MLLYRPPVLGFLVLLCTSWLATSPAAADDTVPTSEPPAVTYPRQTSGDQRVQPEWEERLTLVVGPSDSQIVGNDQWAIQAAVDHVARLGGGTVRLNAGTYRLRNAITCNQACI